MIKESFIVIFILISIQNSYSENFKFDFDGKSYEIIETKSSWTEAANYAKQQGAYLAQINSQEEQDTIYSVIKQKVSPTYTSVMDGGGVAYIWIGGTDINTEGVWIWDGSNSGSGVSFWTGQGSAGIGNGQPVDNRFYNWGGKSQSNSPKEPDNYNGNQHAAAIALEPWPKNMGILGDAGEWNDLSTSNQLYFVIEYDIESGVNYEPNEIQKSYSRPNPIKDNYTEIVYYSDILGDAELIITDIDGKSILKSIQKSTIGENYFGVELENGASLFYNYHILLNDKAFRGKIVSTQ